MQIFCPTLGRAGTIMRDTGALFTDLHCIVQADPQEIRSYTQLTPFQVSRCPLVTPRYKGKSVQIAWALETFVKPGEWVAFVDDDLLGFTALPEPYYGAQSVESAMSMPETRKAMSKAYSEAAITRWQEIVEDTIAEADGVGANLCGFAPSENPFFRQRKWLHCGRVRGEMFLIRRTELQVPVCHHDELWITAAHLARDGCVVINRFAHCASQSWTAGGHGTKEDRLAIMRRDRRELLRAYPALFAEKESEGMPEVRFRVNTLDGARRWREDMETP